MLNSFRHQLRLELERRYLDLQLPHLLELPLQTLEHLLYERPASTVPITKPIFIVGCHRSGTTVLYETLAKHPDLVYFTNASSLFPNIPIVTQKFFNLLVGDSSLEVERFVKDGLTTTHATPSEGVRIWEQYVENSANYCLDETFENPAMDQYLKRVIQKHLIAFQGQRFINKNPDNSVRIRYLNKLFPDAYFIHIVRDGRAVCNSLLKFREAATDFFGADHRHATSGVKVKAWDDIEKLWKTEPVKSIGLLWKEVMETVERDRQVVDSHRFLEFRYEDFVDQPMLYLQKICDFAELIWNPDVETTFTNAAARLNLGNRNEAWKSRLTPEDTNQLLQIIQPLMQQYQYL